MSGHRIVYSVICSVTVCRSWWTDYDGKRCREGLLGLRREARGSLLPGVRWRFYGSERVGEGGDDDDWRRYRFGALLTEGQFAAFVADHDWEYEGESGGILGAPGGPSGLVPSFALSAEPGEGILEAAVCPLPARGHATYDFTAWDGILEAVRRRYFAGEVGE